MNENKGLYKYPRTPHLPFSETITDDDKRLQNTKHFENMPIVITEKMDGENTTIYANYYHARSLSSKHQEYHSWLLQYIQSFQYNLPKDIRLCGEYLYATHSIKYINLESYFLLFGVWKENTCLSWAKVEYYANILGLHLVPILYKGPYSDAIVKHYAKEVIARGGEGIVVRNQNAFFYEDFSKNVAKYVRPNHVQTDIHWSLQEIQRNGLK